MRYFAPTLIIMALSAAGFPACQKALSRRNAPHSFDTLTAAAQASGLYCAAIEASAVGSRMVISRTPLTRDEVNDLRINTPSHPCWIGTVACYSHSETMAANFDPKCSAVWGGFFLYGDPQLIEALTGDELGR